MLNRALAELTAKAAEADELRAELARRRQEDLSGALRLHAARPQGFLQVMEFVMGTASAHNSLLELYLRAIYTAHNPTKLDSPSFIAKVLESYEGEEQQLVDELYERYEIKHSHGGEVAASKLMLDGARRAKPVPSSSQQGTPAGADTGAGTIAISRSLEQSVSAAAQQRVSSLFWAAVMKSAIWALLLSNGALLIINGGGVGGGNGSGIGSCSVDSVVRLAS